MTTRPAVGLSGISYRHGTWYDLKDLAEAEGLDSDVIQRLEAGGVERYSRITEPLGSYYPSCVEESLDGAGVSPADVDAVLFFSSTFSTYENRDDLVRLNAALGIRCALPAGLFLGQCTNFSMALTMARGLVASEGYHHVLLLGADALDESQASRVLPSDQSVFSDAVLSLVVSSSPAGRPFRLEQVGHSYDPELQALDPQRDVLPYIDRFTRSLQGAIAALAPAVEKPIDGSAVEHLVLANLTLPTQKNFAAIVGVPMARVPTGGTARFGHCFSYDQLITIEDLRRDDALEPGQRLLLLGVGGNYLFSAVSMTAHSVGNQQTEQTKELT